MTFPKGNHPDAPLASEIATDFFGMPGWAVEVMLELGFTAEEMLVAEFPGREGPTAEVVDLNAHRLRYLRLSALNRVARAQL